MNIRHIILYIVIMLMGLMLLAGCSAGKTETTETQNTEDVVEDSLYLILEHDTEEETLTLYSYETETEYYFRYSFVTQFLDKYGNYESGAKFSPGRVVSIGEENEDGYLQMVQLSDKVWEYEKIKRFSIDQEKGVFTIADSNYSIQDEVMIFSNGERIYFSDISQDDILTVVGMEKKILSVVVTTGHGTLSLTNTELFEGSFLKLNTNIFLQITENMEIEIPEGTYQLTVANDGWGGSTEIEIVRGETTEVDLDTLKGEGYKKGLITFEINAEDVEVYIDNQLVDHTKPVELTYGTHLLEIRADGYDTWQKYLFVHSETATIVINLNEDAEQQEEETEKDSEKKETESEEESEIVSETEEKIDSETESASD